ncbi:hypothetical protein P7C70_g6417, partial [Phenoliferia sp. Uapishka_3]
PRAQPLAFIPALTRPRNAHLGRAYENEDEVKPDPVEDVDIDMDAEGEDDIDEPEEFIAPPPKRMATKPIPAPVLAPAPAPATKPKSRKRPAPPPDSASDDDFDPEYDEPVATTSRRRSLPAKSKGKAAAKPKKRPSLPAPRRSTSTLSASSSTEAAGSRSLRITSPTAMSPSGTKLRRTEIPAVQDDPSIKPYGCCYPSCIELNRQKAARDEAREGGEAEIESEDEDEDEETSFRTIRELREHCSQHKKRGEVAGDTPFRCALDPCGKTFKSAAGLLWHFTSASAGHFFVSLEPGEDRPSKKFKATVEAHGRSEQCPISGCNKAFKQAAGLAYHLAHTSNHPNQVTEQLLESFGVTLQSKTRWWFKKLNIKIRGGGGGAATTVGAGGGEMDETDEDGEGEDDDEEDEE